MAADVVDFSCIRLFSLLFYFIIINTSVKQPYQKEPRFHLEIPIQYDPVKLYSSFQSQKKRINYLMIFTHLVRHHLALSLEAHVSIEKF